MASSASLLNSTRRPVARQYVHMMTVSQVARAGDDARIIYAAIPVVELCAPLLFTIRFEFGCLALRLVAR